VQGRYVLMMVTGSGDEWATAANGYKSEQAASDDVDRLLTAGVPADTLIVCVDMQRLEVAWTQRATYHPHCKN